MESKEFWNKLLEEANEYIADKYKITMSEDLDNINKSDNYEERVFRSVWKNGKTYVTGWICNKNEMTEGKAKQIGYMIAHSFINTFANLEYGVANGKT